MNPYPPTVEQQMKQLVLSEEGITVSVTVVDQLLEKYNYRISQSAEKKGNRRTSPTQSTV